MAAQSPTLPTYYVRHPDGSLSIAEPQPTASQIAAQERIYAQCDRKHDGGCCPDPDCHVYQRLLRNAPRDELLVAAEHLLAAFPAHATHRNHAERRAYDALRAAIAKVKGGAL